MHLYFIPNFQSFGVNAKQPYCLVVKHEFDSFSKSAWARNICRHDIVTAANVFLAQRAVGSLGMSKRVRMRAFEFSQVFKWRPPLVVHKLFPCVASQCLQNCLLEWNKMTPNSNVSYRFNRLGRYPFETIAGFGYSLMHCQKSGLVVKIDKNNNELKLIVLCKVLTIFT